jgi:hypothetical protein
MLSGRHWLTANAAFGPTTTRQARSTLSQLPLSSSRMTVAYRSSMSHYWTFRQRPMRSSEWKPVKNAPLSDLKALPLLAYRAAGPSAPTHCLTSIVSCR